MKKYKLHKLLKMFLVITIFLFIAPQCKKEEVFEVTIKTYEATSITGTGATIEGEIISSGSSKITKRGICISTKPNPTLVDGHLKSTNTTDRFAVNVTILKPLTKYYYRAFVEGSTGTYYGEEYNFTTTKALPTIKINEITNISGTMAFCSIEISATGADVIASKGIVWSTSQNPTLEDRLGISSKAKYGESIFELISELTPNIIYYLRAYATNSIGTGYSSQMQITTNSLENCGAINDIDGNVYPTVKIGTQYWLAKNLVTTKYRDGSSIPNITDNSAWGEQTTGAYCWYNNDIANKTKYGALYNYHTVVDSRNLCPAGWHVPTDAEWKTLEMYLGMTQVEADATGWRVTNVGKQLMSKTGWSSNTGTNTSGFSALPGGLHEISSGGFSHESNNGYWWSTSMKDTWNAWNRCLTTNGDGVDRNGWYVSFGFSVRCIKD